MVGVAVVVAPLLVPFTLTISVIPYLKWYGKLGAFMLFCMWHSLCLILCFYMLFSALQFKLWSYDYLVLHFVMMKNYGKIGK
jgi:hypothetical protein